MRSDTALARDGLEKHKAPPFQFNFHVFCPWATRVEVLIHPHIHTAADPLLFPLIRMEGALWCGEVDLPGRGYTFSYRCTSPTRSIVAAFEGGYPPPEIYAKVTARATYPGRPALGNLCG